MGEAHVEQSKHAAAKPARILVVDDEEVVHASMRRMLGRKGHEVVGALSAREGLDRLGEASYDLVITDLMMPEMDGMALVKAIRQRGNDVPVLMVTGYPTIRTAIKALGLGVVDYLAKPFTRQELHGPVSRALRWPAEDRAGEAAPAPAEEGTSEAGDGIEAPPPSLAPGEVVRLPRHSWAAFLQDGTIRVGVTGSFLHAVGAVVAVDVPAEADLVEQGYAAIRLRNEAGEEHNVLMPLSGRVMGVNPAAGADPRGIGPATWLVRLAPSRLAQEVPLLERGRLPGAQ